MGHSRPIYKACFIHDLWYWTGKEGEDLERLFADTQLMLNVAQMLQDTKMAEIMFHGVRIGGGAWVKRSFSWGFGRA